MGKFQGVTKEKMRFAYNSFLQQSLKMPLNAILTISETWEGMFAQLSVTEPHAY